MGRGLVRFTWGLLLVALVFASNAPAYAQGGGGATTLSGIVSDSTGGVLPGATIEAKENATGVTYTAVSDSAGRFTIPNILPGTYTVKTSMQGFKAFVAPDVQILTATPATLNAKLEIGAQTESIVVTSATDVVQTQTATVSSTLSVNTLQKMPMITHTALDAVVFSSGVETVGSNTRGSTINGLPTTSINITLDGMNVQDKRGSEGFFMMIRPMMDSVEEITVSTSTPEAAASGAGAASIRMTTRSGTNSFSGSVYNTWRNQAGTNDEDALTRNNRPGWLWRMNSPYWFNKRDLPKTAAGDYFINDVRLETPGFRVGGPILRDKLFYFFNYEEFQLPESRSRQRTLLSEAAQQGNFTYTRADNGQVQTVNLLQLAAARNLTSTLDPTTAKMFSDIRAATGQAGSVRGLDLNLDQYNFVPSATQLRRFPTVKADYNLSSTQRVTGTYRFNKFDSNPDFLNNAEAPFPGFDKQVGTQISGRYDYVVSLNSVFGKWVNEARYGLFDVTGKGTAFNGLITPANYNCSDPGCQSVGGVGYAIAFNANNSNMGTSALTGVGARNPSFDVTAQYSFEDTLTYITGAHSLQFGMSWGRLDYRQTAQTMHQGSITLGMATNDPANLVFDASTGTSVFPGGINTTQAGYSKNLYAALTGRVTNFGATYVLQPDGTFGLHAETTGAAVRDDYGFFVSDTWRVKPNVTLNLGLRYKLEMPITTDGLYSVPEDWRQVYGITGPGDGYLESGNLYKPGVMTGTNDLGVVRYQPGSAPYKTDYNNLAPSVNATWRPNVKSQALAWLTGSDPVLRGGYSMSFDVLGTDTFTGNYGANPGRTRAGSRSATAGTPAIGFDGWPVLMRDTSKLYASAMPPALGENFRLTPAVNESIDIHHPDWKTPIIHQYSVGIQRQIGRDFGLDVRYVGNMSTGELTTWNMNGSAQWSIFENGFYDEFRKAQANLRANIVAGRGNTFAYTGAPGTAPLPIFMAYLAGVPLADGRNQDPAQYTASQFTNSSWYNQLSMYSTTNNLTGIAGTGTNGLQNGLGQGSGLDVNRQRAGLPANFFMANPAIALGSALLEVNGGNRKFNALQVDLTKRLSQGFSLQTNYAYAFGRKTWQQRSLREDWFYVDSGAGADHTFKLTSTYSLPFGQGRAFASGAGPVMNGIVGGWELAGVARWQSGQQFNYGNFRLVGMDEKELQDMFKFYRRTDASGIERIYMLPEDVIANSTLALFTSSATTASGYAGALPTGKYLAPANGPDCVSYAEVECPGTTLTRFITGPGYFKTDLSVVKRIVMKRRFNLEARMDLFNLFDTINFTATSRMASSPITGWDVQTAATDTNASQDPGGRITQFGLRFSF